MTDTNKVDHTTEELNAVWNKTETKTDTLNRQLLGMVPFIINKEKVYQFIIFETGKQIHEALFATDSKNWSQKKIDKFDKENGTQHGLILSEIKDKTHANTIRSICLHCWDNLPAWIEAIESVTPDYKINSLESFYKAIKKAMKATETDDDATETTETDDDATETTDETTETFPEPETVEEFGLAIAALVLAGVARGFDKGEMIQIATDVIKSKS
jgi:hypothetical protein|tara:strand:- start:31 stop:675 length:645 start_codon:yes stop_codon:yes gene_type:complete